VRRIHRNYPMQSVCMRMRMCTFINFFTYYIFKLLIICSYILYIYILHRYNICWYTAPLSIQKLILFLLQRGSKTFTLNVGGLFQASLKCFASVKTYYILEYIQCNTRINKIKESILLQLTSTSISYFTVIYSTQQWCENTSSM